MTISTDPSIVLQLFPEFSGARIIPKTEKRNGAPFLIELPDENLWLKVTNSQQIESEIEDVEKMAFQEIESPYVVELKEIRTKYIKGVKYNGLLFTWIKGRDLSEIFKEKKRKKTPFTDDEVKKLLLEVLEGLKAIWGKGWVHQDIKKQNIRYDEDNNRYIILDLGIAYYSPGFQQTTGKHNRDYASSEQVIASVHNIKVPILTVYSDLSQLAQMAYELLTLKNAFKSNEQDKLDFTKITGGEFVPAKELNPNISDELNEVISNLLHPHPGYRYRDIDEVICLLKNQTYTPETRVVEGVFFQIWKGPQGYKDIIPLVKNSICGIAVSLNQVPSQKTLNEISDENLYVLADPESHLLEGRINPSWHGSLKSMPWYMGGNITPDYFGDRRRVADFVIKVIQSQLDLNADFIVAPYFSINNPESEWKNINALLYIETQNYCKKIGINLPTICVVPVSGAVIEVEQSRMEIVDLYSQLPGVSAYLLRVDAMNHRTAISIIEAIKSIIVDLERHHSVILADADLMTLGYFSYGLSSCITSLVGSRRKHDISLMESEKKKGGNGPKEMFYVPKLFDFIKVDGDLPTLITKYGKEVLCMCSVCRNSGFSADDYSNNPNNFVEKWLKSQRSAHFFAVLDDWRQYMTKLATTDKKVKAYLQLSDASTKLRKDFENDIISQQIKINNDYKIWEEAFTPK